MKSKHAMEQKKITRELFELNSQLKVEEDRVARLTAANKNKEDMTRQKEDEHRVELEKIGRSSRKTSKQHVSIKINLSLNWFYTIFSSPMHKTAGI